MVCKTITEVTIPAHTAVVMREEIPADKLGEFFERTTEALLTMLEDAGLPQPEFMRTYSYSEPAETFDMGNAVIIEPSHATAVELPEGAHIIGVHEVRALRGEVHGSYEQLPEAWKEVANHIRLRGLEPGDVSFEDYLNVPCDVPEEELRTHVVWEVREA